MRNVFVQLFTRNPLTSIESGQCLLQLLTRYIPAAQPSRWDNYTLASHPWPPGNLEQAWNRDDLFWEGHPPETAQGAAFKRTYPTDKHGVVSLELDPEAAPMGDVASFLQELAAQLEGDYGFVHTLPASGPTDTSAFLQMASQDLSKCLPDLWWGMVLGSPYVDLIGSERISTAPAYCVSRVTDRIYWLQLTERPPYVPGATADETDLESRAADIRKHLGDALFWSVGRTNFRTPLFR